MQESVSDNPSVGLRVMHGASGVGDVSVRLLDPRAGNRVYADLENQMSLGEFGALHEIEPRTMNVEVAMAGIGTVIDVYEFDFSHLEGHSMTLALSGSGANANGGLTLMGVLPSGQVRFPGAVVTGLGSPSTLPSNLVLHGNYPNPFNPVTRIEFDLPFDARVEVEIIDVLGRAVKKASPQFLEAGTHRSIEINSSGLTSGLYLYTLSAFTEGGKISASGSMVLIK